MKEEILPMRTHPDYRGMALENIRKALVVTTDDGQRADLVAAESALRGKGADEH